MMLLDLVRFCGADGQDDDQSAVKCDLSGYDARNSNGMEASQLCGQELSVWEACAHVPRVVPGDLLHNCLPHGESRPGGRELLDVLNDVVASDQDHGSECSTSSRFGNICSRFGISAVRSATLREWWQGVDQRLRSLRDRCWEGSPARLASVDVLEGRPPVSRLYAGWVS